MTQLLRYQLWKRIEKLGIPFSQISSAVLLLIIYTTFCDTFSGVFCKAPLFSAIRSSPFVHRRNAARPVPFPPRLTACSTLSAAAGNVEIESGDLFKIVVIIVLIQGAEIIAVFLLSNRLNFRPADTVCAVFCATHKSLTLGTARRSCVCVGPAPLRCQQGARLPHCPAHTPDTVPCPSPDRDASSRCRPSPSLRHPHAQHCVCRALAPVAHLRAAAGVPPGPDSAGRVPGASGQQVDERGRGPAAAVAPAPHLAADAVSALGHLAPVLFEPLSV